MSEDRTLRLAFGDFECEIVGYEQPLALLDEIVTLYVSVAEKSPWLTVGGGPQASDLRASFARAVSASADRLGLAVANRDGAITISRRGPEAEAERPPSHLANMDPGLLAEFTAMRARLRERDEPAQADALAAQAPEAAPESVKAAEPETAMAARPRVRVIRAAAAPASSSPSTPAAPVARTVALPVAEPAAPRIAAVAQPEPLERPAQAAPRAGASTEDNFLFAESPAPEAGAEPAALRPAAPAPAPAPRQAETVEPSAARFGFLRRIIAQTALPEQGSDAAEGAGFRRLREAADAALPRLDAAARAPRAPEPRLSLVSGGAQRAEPDGPAAFAAESGAKGLVELVEAAAAWVALGEKKARFSRRDVMQALAGMAGAADHGPEARMKAFRALLKDGVLRREDDGLYALSHQARFGFESRMRA